MSSSYALTPTTPPLSSFEIDKAAIITDLDINRPHSTLSNHFPQPSFNLFSHDTKVGNPYPPFTTYNQSPVTPLVEREKHQRSHKRVKVESWAGEAPSMSVKKKARVDMNMAMEGTDSFQAGFHTPLARYTGEFHYRLLIVY
jgi:hypothetical protein